MAKGMGWPSWKVVLLGIVELVGSLSILIGIRAQIGAILLGAVMLGALYFKTSVWKIPFTGQNINGWEFDMLLLAANLAIIFTGAGAIAMMP